MKHHIALPKEWGILELGHETGHFIVNALGLKDGTKSFAEAFTQIFYGTGKKDKERDDYIIYHKKYIEKIKNKPLSEVKRILKKELKKAQEKQRQEDAKKNKFRLFFERFDLFIRLEEGILTDVLGIVLVPDHPPNENVQRSLISFDQPFELAVISRLYHLDEFPFILLVHCFLR